MVENKKIYEGQRGLIVEDDELVVGLLVAFLEPLGVKIVVAPKLASLDAALAAAKESGETFDFCITDMDLKENYEKEEGLEVLKRVRKFDPDILVIVSSGHYTCPEAALRAGFDGGLVKPYSMKLLAATLRAVLSVRPAAKKQTDRDRGLACV